MGLGNKSFNLNFAIWPECTLSRQSWIGGVKGHNIDN